MSALKTALVAAAAGLTLAVMSLGSTAFAATQVISLSGPATGNQPQGDLPLDLGMDFTVNTPVTVFSLGAFTNGSNAIPVTLYSSGGAALATTSISGTPVLGSNYAFSALGSPLTLAPGTYQIEATYQPGSNIDYNPFEPGGSSTVVFNNLGGSLTFLADYYNLHGTGAMATTLDALSPNGYGAGTFLANAVPEPATWTMMLVGFFGLGAMVRSSRRKQAAATA
jgi:hypothetical protein